MHSKTNFSIGSRGVYSLKPWFDHSSYPKPKWWWVGGNWSTHKPHSEPELKTLIIFLKKCKNSPFSSFRFHSMVCRSLKYQKYQKTKFNLMVETLKQLLRLHREGSEKPLRRLWDDSEKTLRSLYDDSETTLRKLWDGSLATLRWFWVHSETFDKEGDRLDLSYLISKPFHQFWFTVFCQL